MGRIKNTNVYPVKQEPAITDYFIGSDSENGGDTVNFPISSVISTVSGGGLPDEIISGNYSWEEGTLNFTTTAITFRKNGTIYLIDSTSFTLDDGSAQPRKDRIVVDVNDGIVVIKGTPSADPALPALTDPTNQLGFFFVDIAAFATEPTGSTKSYIYDEGLGEPDEWIATENTSGARIIIDSTDVSNNGTKSIKFLNPVNGANTLSLVTSTPVNVATSDILNFYIYLVDSFTGNTGLRVSFFNGGSLVSNTITVKNNVYGLSGSTLNTFQFISIPLSDFSFSDVQYNRIDFEPVKINGSKTFYLDSIEKAEGIAPPTAGVNHSDINLDDGTNPHGTIASDVGLGNVDNTSDVDKPVSIAQQAALDGKADVVHTHDLISNVANNVLIGRVSAGSGDSEELTPSLVRILLNVENGADVTDSTNVDAAGAVMESDTSTASMAFVIDEDNMSSDSATKVPTQQSVKAYVDNSISNQAEVIGIACSDETTDLTVGVGVAEFQMPFAMTLTNVIGTVTTAPTGSTIIVDINDGGTTIMTTNKISIDASEKTSETAATTPTLTDTALAKDAVITVDIDQIGSTVAGTGLKIWLIGTRT